MKNYIITFICAGFLFLVSCAKPSNVAVSGDIVPAVDIYAAMQSLDIAPQSGALVVNRQYALPDKTYIVYYFKNAVLDWFLKINPNYQAEGFDCDAFSRETACLAQRLYSKSTTRIPNTAIAIGEFYYSPRTGPNHAINFAITKENNNLKIVFFEPQNWQIIQLSKSEIESCFFWRL